jgi:hypothetical protein
MRKILTVNIFEPSLSELSRTSGLQEGVRMYDGTVGISVEDQNSPTSL